MISPVLDRLNPVTLLAMGLVLLVPLVITIDWLSATVVLVALAITAVACRVPLVPLFRRSLPLLVVGPLDEVAQCPDPWVQAYFHGPRGRAAEEAHERAPFTEVK